jgi:8-oxo-dGTP diphosphatase
MHDPVHLVGAALIRDGRVLLGRRSPSKPESPGAWDLFGGHVEAGESAEAALARELMEELGIAPLVYSIVGTYRFSEQGGYRVFRVDTWSGGEPSLRNEEHTELGWFSLPQACGLEPLASPAYRDLFVALIDSSRMHS